MSSEAAERVVRLLTQHQEDVFRYIFALLPHREDARDVLQETSVALYRKAADYDPSQPFLPWAFRFAALEVMKQRERNQRGTLLMSRELIERLAAEREAMEPTLQTRLAALEACLEKLPAGDRELIQRRYQERARADELTEEGVSRRSVFRHLDRIRRLLHECISRRTAMGG
jgi:RNA polymerase sigma-70 factor, ECF subfamily